MKEQAMPAPNPAALDFLLTRRSHPARTRRPPLPDAAQLETILTAAARTPDHGKLEPWRFIVFEKAALSRIAEAVAARGRALALDPDKLAKSVAQYAESDLAVMVVAVPRPTDKVPAIEQTLSAGAVCLSLLNAALASGFGANWLTGWPVYDATLLAGTFGLQPGEWVAGIVHIGTATETPPDRPRPDLSRVVTRVTA
jgi:nitroreductase